MRYSHQENDVEFALKLSHMREQGFHQITTAGVPA